MVGVVAASASAMEGTVPLDFRLAEFAQQIYFPVGPKRLTVVGDSINATSSLDRMIAGYRDSWNVKWNGWVVHADSGASDIGYLNAQNLSGNDISILWNPGAQMSGGQFGVSPVRLRETTYRAQPELGMEMGDCMLVPARTARFPAGDYFASGRVTARPVIFQDFNMLGHFMIRGMRGNTVVGPDTPFAALGEPGRIVFRDVDLGETAGAPRVRFHAHPTIPLPGDVRDPAWRISLLGVLYRNSLVDGVQMSFIALGAFRAIDHMSPAKYSDKALREYYEAIGAPTHLVLWLGQNQTIQENNELLTGVNVQYKANLRGVMDRHNAVIRDMGEPSPRWLLVSQYKTGYAPAVHELMAQSMYELSLADPLVSFINLYDLAGGQGFDSALYTIDGIHPNLAGSVQLARLMNDRMEEVVTCTADFDRNGFVDFVDYSLFMQAFEAGDSIADIDGSEYVDVDDFDSFMEAYFAGC